MFRKPLGPFYSEIGRPSVDPELMIRMLLIGYCYSIRSERRLCDEVRLNLAYRWFCGLASKGRCRTIRRSRSTAMAASVKAPRFGWCSRAWWAAHEGGLVGGEGFAVDASVVEADANKQRSVPGSRVECIRTSRSTPHGRSRTILPGLDDAAFGAASEVTPKFVSPSDPAAQWTGALRGPARVAGRDNDGH